MLLLSLAVNDSRILEESVFFCVCVCSRKVRPRGEETSMEPLGQRDLFGCCNRVFGEVHRRDALVNDECQHRVDL